MPEPVLIAIAAAIAGRAAGSLYDLVRKKFTGDQAATETLAAAEGTADNSPEVSKLTNILEQAERDDPAFSRELRAEWQRTLVEQRASGRGVANAVSGPVSGKVVQARDIRGGVRF
jgi:hypothetical protein